MLDLIGVPKEIGENSLSKTAAEVIETANGSWCSPPNDFNSTPFGIQTWISPMEKWFNQLYNRVILEMDTASRYELEGVAKTGLDVVGNRDSLKASK